MKPKSGALVALLNLLVQTQGFAEPHAMREIVHAVQPTDYYTYHDQMPKGLRKEIDGWYRSRLDLVRIGNTSIIPLETVQGRNKRRVSELSKNQRIPGAGLPKAQIEAILKKVKTIHKAGIKDLEDEGLAEEAESYGFCYGKALTSHMLISDAAKSAGVIAPTYKVALRGLLRSGTGANQIRWDYHVATTVMDDQGYFWVVDPLFPRLVRPNDWYAGMQAGNNPTRDTSFAILPPHIFGAKPKENERLNEDPHLYAYEDIGRLKYPEQVYFSRVRDEVLKARPADLSAPIYARSGASELDLLFGTGSEVGESEVPRVAVSEITAPRPRVVRYPAGYTPSPEQLTWLESPSANDDVPTHRSLLTLNPYESLLNLGLDLRY